MSWLVKIWSNALSHIDQNIGENCFTLVTLQTADHSSWSFGGPNLHVDTIGCSGSQLFRYDLISTSESVYLIISLCCSCFPLPGQYMTNLSLPLLVIHASHYLNTTRLNERELFLRCWVLSYLQNVLICNQLSLHPPSVGNIRTPSINPFLCILYLTVNNNYWNFISVILLVIIMPFWQWQTAKHLH
jgi:hypothetical protein